MRSFDQSGNQPDGDDENTPPLFHDMYLHTCYGQLRLCVSIQFVLIHQIPFPRRKFPYLRRLLSKWTHLWLFGRQAHRVQLEESRPNFVLAAARRLPRRRERWRLPHRSAW